MPKRFLFLFFFLPLLLAGCQQQSPDDITATSQTPQPVASAAVTEAATSTLVQPEPSQAPVVQAPAGCTAVSPQPTPGPTEQSLFPPVTKADWVLGNFDARVTILEYSDFQ